MILLNVKLSQLFIIYHWISLVHRYAVFFSEPALKDYFYNEEDKHGAIHDIRSGIFVDDSAPHEERQNPDKRQHEA